jgi:hypothetical protein
VGGRDLNPARPTDVFTDPDDLRWEPPGAPVEPAAPDAGARLRLATWDAAIDVTIADGDGLVQASDAVAQSAAVGIDPAVSALDSARWAGAAVVLWGAWAVRSRKADRSRRQRPFER